MHRVERPYLSFSAMRPAPHIFFGLLLFLTLFATLGSQPAFAHAVPVNSNPDPNEILEDAPDDLLIRFSEPLVTDLSRIQLLTQLGEPLDIGPLRILDDEDRTLAVSLNSPNSGAYLVSWQVLSAVDGHTTSGTFSFGIGISELSAASPDATITASISLFSALSRWLNLMGIALLIGLFAFRLFIWRPIFTDEELEPEEQQLNDRFNLIAVKIGFLGAACVALGLTLTLIDQSSQYNLLELNNFRIWVNTRFGQSRFVLTGVLLVNLLIILTTLYNALSRGNMGEQLLADTTQPDSNDSVEEPAFNSTSLVNWQWWAGLALSLGLAFATSLVSHSAALQENVWQATLVDFMHILAASIWVGGLLLLAVGLWQARSINMESRAWINLMLILNFSALAAAAVGALGFSGGYLAWKHIGSWTILIGTIYGLLLLGKIALALIAFLIAAINLLYVKPRVQQAYDKPESATAQPALRRFRGFVYAEAIIALLILVSAGVLTDLQRGVDAPLLSDAPGKTVVARQAEDVNVELTIEPALIGQNTFDIQLTDENGEPIEDASEVLVRFTFLERSIGADGGTAIPQGNGFYRLEGSYISLIGTWQLEVAIRRPDRLDTFAPYRLNAGVGGTIQTLDSGEQPLEQVARFLTIAAGAGTGLGIVLFALFWGFAAIRAARNEWQFVPMLLGAAILAGIGGVQIYTFFQEDFTPTKFLTNPMLPDVESIAIGNELYTNNCTVCHGLEGYGDGPAAVGLQPPPANFGDGHTASHPDGDLYYWILNGVQGTAMPAFGEQLSEEEAWHLVNYIRRLSTTAVQ